MTPSPGPIKILITSFKVPWAWLVQAQILLEQLILLGKSAHNFYILQYAVSVGRIIVKMADPGSQSVRSASQEISTEFKTLVDSQDLDSIKQSQNLILGRLQDSNAVLSHFNEYSENCFAEVSADFSRNTRLLRSMKSDLDYIFQKLRSLKAKIMETYPDAFPDDSAIEALDQRPDLELPR